jgi:hypothetical protein
MPQPASKPRLPGGNCSAWRAERSTGALRGFIVIAIWIKASVSDMLKIGGMEGGGLEALKRLNVGRLVGLKVGGVVNLPKVRGWIWYVDLLP